MDDPESSSGIGVETIPAFPIIEVIRFVAMLLRQFILFIVKI